MTKRPDYDAPDYVRDSDPAVRRKTFDTLDLGPCRACPATVRWRTVAKTGRKMPLDVEPRADGNVYLDAEGRAVVVGKAAKARLVAAGRDPGPWYVSHFATCPGLKARR